MRGLAGIGLLPQPFLRIDPHEHSIWEIVYYISSRGILKIGTEELQFEPGNIVCQPPGVIHSEYSEIGFCNFLFVNSFDNPQTDIMRFKDTPNGDFYNILLQLYREFRLKRKR